MHSLEYTDFALTVKFSLGYLAVENTSILFDQNIKEKKIIKYIINKKGNKMVISIQSLQSHL